MPLPHLKAVLFDMDGTLVDSEGAHWQAWVRVLRRHGAELDEATYRTHHAGMPTLDNAVDVQRRYALSATVDELVQAKVDETRAHIAREGYPLQPATRATLDWCHAHGLRCAVVTGASQEAIHTVLGPHGLLAHFDTLVGMDDVPRNKPFPDCYLLALDRLGLQAGEAVAFEDSQHGLAAAVAAGVPAIAIPTPISAEHDFSRATAICTDLVAATDWLTRHRTLPR
ncbi:HAD family hydrolase [Sphaerotilus mobilis]|nr:HAD family phosphatase [Sphaerotilus mobilis]